MATIKSMHILWRQTKNFSLDRENIGNQYIFLYFQTPNIVLTKNGNAYTRGNSFIIHDKYSHQYFKAVEKDLLHDWMHIEGSLDSIMKKAQLEYNVLYEIPNGSFITKIMHDLELEFLPCTDQPEHRPIVYAPWESGQHSQNPQHQFRCKVHTYRCTHPDSYDILRKMDCGINGRSHSLLHITFLRFVQTTLRCLSEKGSQKHPHRARHPSSHIYDIQPERNRRNDRI